MGVYDFSMLPKKWNARFGAEPGRFLSVGNFDGLHLGHQKILRLLLERARATSQHSLVVTYRSTLWSGYCAPTVRRRNDSDAFATPYGIRPDWDSMQRW